MKYAEVQGKSYSQMMRPAVAFDLDGVLVNINKAVLRYLEYLGHKPEWDVFPTWEPESWGIPEEMIPEMVKFFISCQEYADMEPIEGSLELFNFFRERGDTIYVITSREKSLKVVTIGWLMYHGFKPHEVIFTQQKGKAAKANGITMAFEDNAYHIEDLWNNGVYVFRPEYPYNTEAPGVAYRDPKQLLEKLRDMAKLEVARV